MFRFRERIDVSDIAEQSLLYKNIDRALADTFDIHAISADEVYELLFDLSRTTRISTIIMNIFIEDFRSTGRTTTRHQNFLGIFGPTIRDSADDIRDHFSAPLQSYSIMHMNIFGGDEIMIMQTDSLDSDTAEFYRFEISDRSDDACTTDLEINRIDLSGDHLCRKFVSYCPSRMMIGRPYELAQILALYFDDESIKIYILILKHLLYLGIFAQCNHLIDSFSCFHSVKHRQS